MRELVFRIKFRLKLRRGKFIGTHLPPQKPCDLFWHWPVFNIAFDWLVEDRFTAVGVNKARWWVTQQLAWPQNDAKITVCLRHWCNHILSHNTIIFDKHQTYITNIFCSIFDYIHPMRSLLGTCPCCHKLWSDNQYLCKNNMHFDRVCIMSL